MRATPLTHKTTLVAVIAAAVTAGLLVMQASSAAFTSVTDNTGNHFGADTVELTDNDADAAMFEVDDMVPGQEEVRCITVSYSGASDSDVNLYAAIGGLDELAPYLDLTIDADLEPQTLTTAGDFDCPGDLDASTVVQATTKLDSFVATSNDFDSGVGNITFADGDDVVYRFTAALDADHPTIDDAQGESVTDLTFTWESQTQ